MNNPNNMLIIESRSNYAFQLKGKNLSFSEIRNTSTAFFTSLPEGVRNELYNNMCHGTVKLDCEPGLNAYMYAFGAMHNAKLRDAFSHLSTNFFNEREIDVIDYGCGQAMGCISYADYLRENNHTQNVRRITLIEPSYIALARAALHSSLLFPNAEIVTINKGFDDLIASDIEVDSNIPTLHIFSNVLDMGSTPNYNGVFNLGTFSNLVLEISKGYNEYVITEPLFSDFHRDEQTDIFTSSLGINVYYERKCNTGEFVANKTWTCVIKCGSNGKPKLVSFEEESTNELELKCYSADEGDVMPNNEIWYTSSGGEIVMPYYSAMFGAVIVSNTYNNGKGVIKFNGNVTKIGEKAFSGCLNLRSIIIPNSVTTIGEGAFEDSSNLTSITIPDGVTKIGDFAFKGCCSLTRITIPMNVTKIGRDGFSGCSSLTSVNIPNSVTQIEKRAFNCCFSLINVSIPNSVTKIGEEVFRCCVNLRSVNIPNSITEINGTFKGSSLISISIPDSVTKIGDFAFSNCHSLTNVFIPNSVTKIGKKAFKGCTNLSWKTKLKILKIRMGL